MIVIDASAFIDAVDDRPDLIDRLVNADIHPPHLLDVEVISALRRLVWSGRSADQRAADALSVLEAADICRHPPLQLLPAIWRLRGRVSAYTAAHISLAGALGAPLLTSDRKPASVSGPPCVVELDGTLGTSPSPGGKARSGALS